MANPLDLLTMFSAVSDTLSENKSELNKADSYNGDHGDNMVQIFGMVTDAISNNQGSDIATQLSAASQTLGNQKSGSAQEYAKGFATAADEFQGGELTADGVLPLLQSLFGGGAKPQPDSSMQGLLGGLLGGRDGKIDAGDLLSAGMSFLSAKNQGKNTQEALIQALIAQSAFGESPHRAQSSQLVAGSIFDLIGSLSK